MRKDELNAISGPNEFAEFYNRLKLIKEFHRKHPNEVDKGIFLLLSFLFCRSKYSVFVVSISDLCAHVSGV